MEQFNSQDIWPKPSTVRVLDSDASVTGYVGYTVEHGSQVVTGQWSNWEAKQSSTFTCTWREFRAVRLVLELFYFQLKGEE